MYQGTSGRVVKAQALCAWPDSLLNGSQMGRRIREFDWSRTPLGPIAEWPQCLRDHVGMLVDNSFAMYIFWGPQNIAIYNDGYSGIAGAKHPRMLGMPTEEIWREVWPDIAPLLERAKSGRPVTLTDLRLIMERNGFPEETYFTFSYSPLRDDAGAIAGVLATVTETTPTVVTKRRLETLRDLAFRSTAALTEAEALAHIRRRLEEFEDMPFGLIYLANEGSNLARVASRIGRATYEPPPFDVTVLDDAAFRSAMMGRFADPGRVVIMPIAAPDRQRNIGALVASISPQLRLEESYREFVTLLAAQIGNSIAAARAFGEERARAESLHVTRTLEKIGLFAESGQQLFWMTKPDGSIDWYNQAWYDYTGQTPDEAKGWGWRAVHHPDDLPEVMRRWPESLEKRAPFEMSFRLRGKDGRYRWFLTRAVPEFDDDTGEVIRWYGTNTNIDSERRIAQQYDVLASLSDRLVQNPDRNAALSALAESLVPELADWTLVNLVDAQGDLSVGAAHHRDAEKTRALQPFVGKSYAHPDGTHAAQEVLRTRKPVLLESVTPGMVQGRVCDEFRPVVESLGMRSAVVVPIMANQTFYGTFHAVSIDDGKAYTARDVPFFEEIGRRIGFALQNAEAYERERRIAHAFQSAALPAALPMVPGMRFSSLYEPASHEANVGGDFYDAFRLLDGRVVVSIGDVAGAGLRAAATMAALRQSIRAVASVNPDPDMLLKAADGVLSASGRAPFASAFVAVIDPLTFSIQYANAGHPSPALRGPGGSVEMLGGNDLLLGLGISASRRVGKAIAEPGSLLVLYTDGLTEVRRNPLEGEERVRGALADGIDDAREIWEAVVGPGVAAHDDVAIIAVHLDTPLFALPKGSVYRWHFSCEDGNTARRVRTGIVRELRSRGLGSEDIFATEVIFSELIGNVFRHAGETLDVVLDLTQEAPVLHVLDSGAGFFLNPKLPADALAERGRGLYIVNQFAREFTVSPRTTSQGSHARAVLRGYVTRAARAVALESHGSERDSYLPGAAAIAAGSSTT